MHNLMTIAYVTVFSLLAQILLSGQSAAGSEIMAARSGPGAVDHAHTERPASRALLDDGRGSIPAELIEHVAEAYSERNVRRMSGTLKWGDESTAEALLQIAQHASDSLNEALMIMDESRIAADSTKHGICPFVAGIQEYRYPVRYARILRPKDRVLHGAATLLQNVHICFEPIGDDEWGRNGQVRLSAQLNATVGWAIMVSYASPSGSQLLADGTLADNCDCLQSDDSQNAADEPLRERWTLQQRNATKVELISEGYKKHVVTELLEGRHGIELVSLIAEREDVEWQELAVRVDRIHCGGGDTQVASVAFWAIVHSDGVEMAFDIPLFHLTACKGQNVDASEKRMESLNIWAQMRRGAINVHESHRLPFTLAGDAGDGRDRRLTLHQVSLPMNLSEGLSVVVIENPEENVRVLLETGSGQQHPLITMDTSTDTDSEAATEETQ